MRKFLESFYKYAEDLLDTLELFDKAVFSDTLREAQYNYDQLAQKMQLAQQQFTNLQNLLRHSNAAAQRSTSKTSFLKSASDLIRLLTQHYNKAKEMNSHGTPISNLREFQFFCQRNILFLKNAMSFFQCL